MKNQPVYSSLLILFAVGTLSAALPPEPRWEGEPERMVADLEKIYESGGPVCQYYPCVSPSVATHNAVNTVSAKNFNPQSDQGLSNGQKASKEAPPKINAKKAKKEEQHGFFANLGMAVLFLLGRPPTYAVLGAMYGGFAGSVLFLPGVLIGGAIGFGIGAAVGVVVGIVDFFVWSYKAFGQLFRGNF